MLMSTSKLTKVAVKGSVGPIAMDELPMPLEPPSLCAPATVATAARSGSAEKSFIVLSGWVGCSWFGEEELLRKKMVEEMKRKNGLSYQIRHCERSQPSTSQVNWWSMYCCRAGHKRQQCNWVSMDQNASRKKL